MCQGWLWLMMPPRKQSAFHFHPQQCQCRSVPMDGCEGVASSGLNR